MTQSAIEEFRSVVQALTKGCALHMFAALSQHYFEIGSVMGSAKFTGFLVLGLLFSNGAMAKTQSAEPGNFECTKVADMSERLKGVCTYYARPYGRMAFNALLKKAQQLVKT